MDLYENIKKLCFEYKDVTVSRMCVECGLSKSTMSELHSGRVKSITASTALKIANYLGVPVDYVLHGAPERKEETFEEEMFRKNSVLFHRIGRLTDADKQVIETVLKGLEEKYD